MLYHENLILHLSCVRLLTLLFLIPITLSHSTLSSHPESFDQIDTSRADGSATLEVLTVVKTEMSSQQVSLNKVMYFCHPSVWRGKCPKAWGPLSV